MPCSLDIVWPLRRGALTLVWRCSSPKCCFYKKHITSRVYDFSYLRYVIIHVSAGIFFFPGIKLNLTLKNSWIILLALTCYFSAMIDGGGKVLSAGWNTKPGHSHCQSTGSVNEAQATAMWGIANEAQRRHSEVYGSTSLRGATPKEAA